jgi:hypothetical protein
VVDPVFWLGVSILLVAVSITAVLMAALPAFRELARAARSAEKLFDTLNREMPPTLKSIRDTGAEISSLTEDMSEGVQGAGRVAQQVDQSLSGATKKAQVTTRGMLSGVKAAWKTFNRSEDASQPVVSGSNEVLPSNRPSALAPDPQSNSRQLPASTRPTVEIETGEAEENLSNAGLASSVEGEKEAIEDDLSHYSDSVARLTEELELIRDRLTHQKRGDVLNK